MTHIYHPTSYTWETQAIINNVIREYENPDNQEIEFDPFEYHDPWNMHIIYTPTKIDSDISQELSDEQYFITESEPLCSEPWEWWSEQLFC